MGTRDIVVGDETPDVAELQGRETEPTIPAIVPVTVEGPVQVRPLPARSFAIRDMALANGADPQRLVGAELQRSRVQVTWSGGDLVIAPSYEEASGNKGRVPVGNSPMTFLHADEIWVKAPAADVTVVVHIEQWAL